MSRLDPENTNLLAHRVADDSLMFHCPACDHGEVPVVALIERETAGCIDCGRRYRLSVEPVTGE
jgi:transcription elongation factor Elf1